MPGGNAIGMPDSEPPDEEDACAVCFGIICQPARVSNVCDHKFCRLCVFKCSSLPFAGCPLCRAPMAEGLEKALVPSLIDYDEAAAAALAAAHPALYEQALRKEALVEERLRERMIPSLPLVLLPGSCARGRSGEAIRLKLRQSVTLRFSEPEALRTIASHSHEQFGIIYRESSVCGGALRGFVVRLGGDKTVGHAVNGSYRVKLVPLKEFQLVGRIRRSDGGCLLGAVEVTRDRIQAPARTSKLMKFCSS